MSECQKPCVWCVRIWLRSEQISRIDVTIAAPNCPCPTCHAATHANYSIIIAATVVSTTSNSSFAFTVSRGTLVDVILMTVYQRRDRVLSKRVDANDAY